MEGMYIYAIAKSGRDGDLGMVGIDGASPVRQVARDGLSCVVSDHGGPEFRAMTKEELVRTLLSHQRVVEEAMRGGTVLPVKFGTLLKNTAEVRFLLSQNQARLAEALDGFMDKVELEVAATWQLGRVLEQVGKQPEVARAKEEVLRRGRPTLEDQLRMGQLVRSCLDARRERYRKQMLDVLQPIAQDVAFNALLSDDMVMNVGFLVERARQRDFDDAVRRLDALFRSEITFRVIGPLPPYSFCTVRMARITEEQVEAARQALGLRGAVSKEVVRRAYRRQAAEAQRGGQVNGKPAAGDLTRLKEASELLLRTPWAKDMADGNGHAIDAADGDFFHVTIAKSSLEEVAPARFGGSASP